MRNNKQYVIISTYAGGRIKFFNKSYWCGWNSNFYEADRFKSKPNLHETLKPIYKYFNDLQLQAYIARYKISVVREDLVILL